MIHDRVYYSFVVTVSGHTRSAQVPYETCWTIEQARQLTLYSYANERNKGEGLAGPEIKTPDLHGLHKSTCHHHQP